MIRAYLAVIQDSFREALASRVLWTLLLMITLLLAALAPLGYRQQATGELNERDVRDWPRFILHFADQAKQPEPTASKHILSLLDKKQRERVLDFRMPKEGEPRRVMEMLSLLGDFRKSLNESLQHPDFYDAAAWGGVRISSKEARELAELPADEISIEDLARLNRLRLETAFPEHVRVSPPTSIKFGYLWYDIGQPFPFRKADFQRFLQIAVDWITWALVGWIGLFVAILVTASIIPQTFDPGQLNLLLSKPIWRSLLFLSKFLGGCVFVLLNATYLVVGLWLILGSRFGLWDPKILLCIPIYVFMFSIYYAVSACVGLLWRNAIVSIVVTLLFGFACFAIEAGKSLVEQMFLDKTRIVHVLEAGDTLVSVNEIGLVHRWDDSSDNWEEIFQSDDEEAMQRRMATAFMPVVPPELRPLGPVYDQKHDQLVMSVRSLHSGQMSTLLAPRDDDWRANRGATASIGTLALLQEPDGSILSLSSVGVFRLVGDGSQATEPLEMFGFSIPLPAPDPFRPVGPDPGVLLSGDSKAAINQQSGELAVFSRRLLTILRPTDEGPYERRIEKQFTAEEIGDIALGFGGDTLLMARDDGRIVAYDAQTLQVRKEFTVEGKNQPRFVTASPDGKHFAVVFHHGRLWIYDRQADDMLKAPVSGQRTISCCVFPSSDRALVVDHLKRVTAYELPNWKPVERYRPAMSLLERIHRYFLVPLYTVFPKPGELDKTIQYILTGKETAESGSGQDDLGTAQTQLHPWRPVYSSLIFTIVLLGLGCLYLHRQDF